MTVTTHPDPNVQVKMRWEPEFARTGQMRAGDHYRLVVSDNGVEHSALDIFEDAFKSWERFLGQWGFIEGTFVPGRPLPT